MSTKSSLLLSADNEHWYEELNARYNEDLDCDRCFVLELDGKHEIEIDEDDGSVRVIIKQDTALYKAIVDSGS